MRRRPLFTTKKEAVEFEKSHRFGTSQASQDSITINDAFKAYFADVSENKVKNTKTNERRYFNLAFHFFTSRGRVYLSEIELRDLQALQHWFEKEQVLGDEVKEAWKASTVNRAFHTLTHFFTTMVEWKKLEIDPSQNLKGLKEPEPEIEVIEPAVYRTALSNTPLWFVPTLEFIHEVGCRPSSVSRLKWCDVNIAGREFTLTVKKGKERRLVYTMSDHTFATFIRLRNQYPHLGPNDFVFRGAKGAPISNAWISRKGCRLFKQVKPMTGGAMKALRHTLASDLTTAGVPTEVVRQALGHSNIRTTQRYAKGIKPEVISRAISLVRGNDLAPNGTNGIEDKSLGATKGS
ncbi:MAG: tyrosine-type recombinase/integrase [Bdellovibrionales bacterium]